MSKIRVVQGDITDQTTEAIVNAANNHLWMGGGVAGAIKRRGGDSIEREAVAQGPIPVGRAIVTGAGKLAARFVIHAAVMGQDLQTNADMIRDATANSLLVADSLKLRSIAFPALGTGVGRFPADACAHIMLDTVRKHLAGHTALQEVVFVLWDEKTYQAFQHALAEQTIDE